MSFDFMKEFLMLEDQERFAGLCEQIEDAIMQALAMTPPELAADIYNSGIL